jgi:hypothetical protein
MTWTKLSDDFTDDIETLSDAAVRLHVEGLVWSNKKLLDLKIPKTDLRRFAKSDAAIPELLAGEWWEDEGDHFVIRHHAAYQRLRAAVINQQAANRENRAKRGKVTAPAREIRFKESSNDSSHRSSNDSLARHDSSNERDRSGRDEEALEVAFNEKTGEVLAESDSTPRKVESWAVAPIPTGRACKVCLVPLRADSPVDVCAKQDDAHADARRSAA